MEWRTIKGYGNRYQVTEDGQARSLKAHGKGKGKGNRHQGKILSPSITTRGYPFVILCYKRKQTLRTIHSLVVEVWIGKKPSLKHYCYHKDGNKRNNYASNLEWLTSKQYCKIRRNRRVTRLITEDMAININVMRKSRKSITEIAQVLGLEYQYVQKYLSGKTYAPNKIGNIFYAN